MDILAEIQKEHSKTQAVKIADYIGNSPERFAELMGLFFHKEYRMAQRAAWPVSICADKYPSLIYPYINLLLENLQYNKVHDATKRNTFRVLQYIDIPGENIELTANVCFDYLTDKTEAIAIRVFAMTVLSHVCKKLPELKGELCILIEDELPFAVPAFISRGKKILKELKRL